MKLDNEIHNLIKQIINTNEAHTCALFVAVSSKRQLTLRSIYSLSRNINEEINVEFGIGLIGWVADSIKPLNASQFRYDPRNLPYYLDDVTIKSFLAVPVVNDSALLGVLCIDSKRSYVFTDKDQKILSGFADQFSFILQREEELAILIQESEDYKKFISLHREITSESRKNVLDLMIGLSEKIVQFHTCSISLLDEEQKYLRVERASGYSDSRIMGMVFPADSGIAGIVLRDRKGLVIPTMNAKAKNFFIYAKGEPRPHVFSFMGIPLIDREDTIGFLSYTRKEGTPFTNRDLQLVSILADHAAEAFCGERTRKKMQAMRELDPLTGLMGHSAFHRFLKQAVSDPAFQRPQALLVVSPDNFKTVNRRYGYAVGDEVLRKLSHILTRLVNSQDIVCREQGKEFAVLLGNADRGAGVSTGEKIRRTLEGSIIVALGCEINLTVSVGVVTIYEDTVDAVKLFLLARQTVKSAKKKGKNTICVAGEREIEPKKVERKMTPKKSEVQLSI